MSILQISRIQLRRGLQENLPPQLASGEMGWSVDPRRLFIGNGTFDEGSPELDNTEIMTSNNDLNMVGRIYTYRGLAAGYEVQTADSFSATVERSIQDKLDDIVNIRDFGGVGDGAHDDAHNINHAIQQLYRETLYNSERRIFRTLYLPAGTYKLASDYIHMLPYVKLKGDGKNSTFIIQTNVAHPCVLGSEATTALPVVNPGKFELEGVTLINQTNKDVVYFDSVTDTYFSRVAMIGTLPGTLGVDKFSCVKIGLVSGTPGSASLSSRLVFNACDFSGRNYAFYGDNNLSNVTIFDCSLTDLYRGISLGEGFTGSAIISGIRVMHSTFDRVAREGIYVADSANISHVSSGFNEYKNVGNNMGVNPFTAVIKMGGNNCYSIGDMFARSSTAAIEAVNLNGKASFATMSDGRFRTGKQVTVGGREFSLLNNQPSNVSANVFVGVGTVSTIIDYTLTRNSLSRIGAMKIASDGLTVSFDDDYIETSDLGVEITPVISGGVIDLQYTTTDDTNPAILLASSRTLV